MDPKTCSKSVNVCENEAVIVKGQTSDSVSSKVLMEEEVEDVNKPQQQQENDSRKDKDGVSCSSNISAHAVQEEAADNVGAVSSNEAESGTSKAKAKEFHTVDLSGGGERICRICHFGSDQSPEATGDDGKLGSPDLFEIGCKCKNELGLAHFHCAEAWFRLRGNSVCEICGCTAKNVTVRLMEDWTCERDYVTIEHSRPPFIYHYNRKSKGKEVNEA